ncbi:MAG TPA: serine hydrolase [Chitinophagaceae bacterium]|nr:serine hydrolase [Chitinophagaceae bacterium]
MKKFFKRFFLFLLLIILVFSGYAVITGRTYLFKAVYYNFADIDDYKIFSNDTISTATSQPWTFAADFNKHPLPDTLHALLERLRTVAVVVTKSNSLLFEKYWDGYSEKSLSNSFSMAKSYTSLLIGAAIKEGKISSVEEPVGDFLPEFKQGLGAKLRIKDLLTMSSGSDWNESYANPLSVTTEAYYGNDLYKTATGVKIVRLPGSYHTYHSGDTQLLGLLLEKATGKRLSEYASEKLWQPLGAEQPALWSTDKAGGHAKAYCCVNSNARDFARIGQLMLDSGRWKGTEIIDPAYYSASISPCLIPDEEGKPCDYYGYQWWLRPNYPGVFYARGILGQYTIVIPSRQIVVVRLGHMRSSRRPNGAPEEIDALINWAMTL